MRPRSQDNRGVFAVMAMLVLLLIVVGAIAIRLFVQSTVATKPETDENAKLAQELQDELTQVKQQLDEALAQPARPLVQNGIYVRQRPDNRNWWTATVAYPTVSEGLPPSFELQYPDDGLWGLMRVEYQDMTATDGEGPTPYLAQFTMRSSTNYSEGAKGHVFYVYVVDRALYEQEAQNPKSEYVKNEDILVGQDDMYAYVYRYANDDADIREAVDAVMNTFVPLNMEVK